MKRYSFKAIVDAVKSMISSLRRRTVGRATLVVSLAFLPACLDPVGIPLSKKDADVDDSGGVTDTSDSDTSIDTDTDSGDTAPPCLDADGDGHDEAACGGDDCNDNDSGVNPDVIEACTDLVDLNCDGVITGIDNDADGSAACEDCDDNNGGAFPGNTEICDEVDNDCDGNVDDGVTTTYYADIDGDGYGDDTITTEACSLPTGYSEKGGDCNDGDSAYNPGATEGDCADPNDYNCDGSVGAVDGDSDGWYACEDCDDGDLDISPDGVEVCDGLDNDCSGIADDGITFTVYYGDADGDGYGNTGLAVSTCDGAPVGYVNNDGDCDDSDVTAYPSAPETCTDLVDLNCDGSVGYADADGDGWAACEECDDANAGANPEEVESCDGGKVDEDCDGLVDDEDPDVADQATWYADADDDGHGNEASSVLACEQPAGYTTTTDDCDDGNADRYPGNGEVCDDGVDQDCDEVVDNSELCDTGAAPDTGDPGTVDTADTAGDTAGGDTSGGTGSETGIVDTGGGDTGIVVDTGDTGTVITGPVELTICPTTTSLSGSGTSLELVNGSSSFATVSYGCGSLTDGVGVASGASDTEHFSTTCSAVIACSDVTGVTGYVY